MPPWNCRHSSAIFRIRRPAVSLAIVACLVVSSPAWYRSAAYRSRTVKEPRAVLAEFGLDLPETVKIRVWDSTAELRYLVIPERPAGTEDWSEDQLAAIVTRDSMIGTDRDLKVA